MNLPPPAIKFEHHNSVGLNVLSNVSEDSMNTAVQEAIAANDNSSHIAVALNVTWQKRGYYTFNSVVWATVVDFEALAKYCLIHIVKKIPSRMD
ncbi:hypothetical protein NPIL_334361 [Nephila pilipes]|uniref:Uncharacterized protein n=1 Tax=Nephila pilipes TaxID=299642 RepID=A0A8X6MWG7_NEPPI|nr:hypothetical protein NPIL_334361 [Nephila pilipes]